MDNRPIIIIIAAGSSSRLGAPKQLQSYKGGTLLSHTVKQCLNSELGPVRVVLGYNHEIIADAISSLPVEIVVNEKWEMGMGSSISAGVKDVDGNRKGIYIVLSDLPFFTSQVLLDIDKETHQNPPSIIVSKNEQSIGPPVFFPVHYKDQLEALKGDEGARNIIRRTEEMVYVDFSMGHIDIDRPEDLKYLKD